MKGRRIFFRRTVTALLAGVLMAAVALPGALAAPKAPFELQCITDQQTAVPGGSVSYHILYHSVHNKRTDHVWLKVKVKGDAEFDGGEGAEWDAVTKTVKWQLHDIESNGAAVLHFNLKVKETAKLGESVDVDCVLQADDDEEQTVPTLHVKLGTNVDQPFLNGYPDGKFHPERSITRAETAAIIARIKQLTELGSAVYPDVPKEHWAYGYIEKVTKAGYMVGDDKGMFRPDDPITRAEFVTLLLRVRGVKELPLKGYADSDEHWSKGAVATAKELRYMDDYSEKYFKPDAALERRYAAKLMDIALQRGPLVDGLIKVAAHWPDVPRSDAFFGWIEEASLVAHESKSSGGKEWLIRYLPDQTKPM